MCDAGANTTESYSYDPVGNRPSSLNVPSYTVNTSNEVTAAGEVMCAYDNNGNTTSKTDSTGTIRTPCVSERKEDESFTWTRIHPFGSSCDCR